MRQAQVIDKSKEPVNVLGMSFPAELVAGYNHGKQPLARFEFKASIMADAGKTIADIEQELRQGYRENMGHEFTDEPRDAAQEEQAQLAQFVFSEPAGDKPQYVIYRDWRFPADLVDVYNFGRAEGSKFQVLQPRRTDTYESLYQMLVDEYQEKIGDKLGLKAEYNGKPDAKYQDWYFPADLVEVYNVGRQQLERFENRNFLAEDSYQSLYQMLVEHYQSALGRDYPGLREPDVLIGNWQFPADLVAVYNLDKSEAEKFKTRDATPSDDYQLLFEQLVEGYNSNAENNYVGQLASSHSARQASMITNSPLGIPVLAEATTPFTQLIDNLDELKPQMAAFEAETGVPFENYLASNQQRIEWQREKEQGQRSPSILRQVFNWAKEMGQELERGIKSGFGFANNEAVSDFGEKLDNFFDLPVNRAHISSSEEMGHQQSEKDKSLIRDAFDQFIASANNHNYTDSEAFQQSVDAVRAQMPIFSDARYHPFSNEVELFLWPDKSFEKAPCYAKATELGCKVVKSSSGKGTTVRFSKEAFEAFTQPLLLKGVTADNSKGLTEQAPEQAWRVHFADENQSAIDINPDDLDEMAAVRNKKPSS